MKGLCKECGKEFELPADELKRAKKLKDMGIPKIFTSCIYCDEDVRVELIDLKPESINYRCPVAQCSGWVDYVEGGSDETPFWGCGECGSRWKQEKNIFAEIVAITKQYSYRKKCYEKISKSKCIPGDMGNEVEDYQEKVLEEVEDTRNEKSGSYFRD